MVAPLDPAIELFVDRAAETGLDFSHFNGMSGSFYQPEMMGPGVGLLDYDNDGDLDVYLVQGELLGNGTPLMPLPEGQPPGDSILPERARRGAGRDADAAVHRRDGRERASGRRLRHGGWRRATSTTTVGSICT